MQILNNTHIKNDGNRLSFDFRKYFQRCMEIYYDAEIQHNIVTMDDCYELSCLVEKLSSYLKLNFEVAKHPIFFTYTNDCLGLDPLIDKEKQREEKQPLVGIVQDIFNETDFIALDAWKVIDDDELVPEIRGFCFSQRDVFRIGGIQQRNTNGILNLYETNDLASAVLLVFAKSLDVSQFWSSFENLDWDFACFQPNSAECFGHEAVTNFIKKNRYIG